MRWRRGSIGVLLAWSAVAATVYGADDSAPPTTAPSAASLPWAVRHERSKNSFIIQGSSIAVPMPVGTAPSDIGTGGFCPPDMGYVTEFMAIRGDKADSNSAAAAIAAVAVQFEGKVKDGSVTADTSNPAETRAVIIASNKEEVPTVVLQKVVDSQLVTAVVWGPHVMGDVTQAGIDAASKALDSAQVVERKKVVNHNEVGGDQAMAQPPQPAQSASGDALPWAVRNNGGHMLLILKNSSIAVPIPDGMMPMGEDNDEGGFASKDTKFDITIKVGPGDKADSDTATAAFNDVATQWKGTVVDKSLVVDSNPAQVHGIINAMSEMSAEAVRQKVFDGQVLTALIFGGHGKEVPQEAIDAAGQALDGAQTVERKKVIAHNEVGDTPGMGQGQRPPRQNMEEADGGGRSGPHGPGPGGMHAPPPQQSSDSSSSSSTLSGSAQRDAWAAAALTAAKKLATAGNDADAYDRYQYIMHEYPKSPSAKDAQDAIAAYEASPDMMAKIHPKGGASTQPSEAKAAAPVDPATKAAGILSMGENYLTAGQDDLAREKFKAVVDQYPDTPSAATAKQHIADLDAQGK